MGPLLVPRANSSDRTVDAMSASRTRRGFTLIELLIVVVILGILAAIAIPKFRNTKGKAFLASMKSDLKNLATAQEAYFYEHSVYATDTLVLQFHTSNGVVLDLTSGDAAGWGGQATHPQAAELASRTAEIILREPIR